MHTAKLARKHAPQGRVSVAVKKARSTTPMWLITSMPHVWRLYEASGVWVKRIKWISSQVSVFLSLQLKCVYCSFQYWPVMWFQLFSPVKTIRQWKAEVKPLSFLLVLPLPKTILCCANARWLFSLQFVYTHKKRNQARQEKKISGQLVTPGLKQMWQQTQQDPSHKYSYVVFLFRLADYSFQICWMLRMHDPALSQVHYFK